MKVTGYLTVKPIWGSHGYNKETLQRLVMEKVTTQKPKTGGFGSAVIKLTVDIPDHVFKPFEVDAEIEVQANEVGTIKVVVEPFEEEDKETV